MEVFWVFSFVSLTPSLYSPTESSVSNSFLNSPKTKFFNISYVDLYANSLAFFPQAPLTILHIIIYLWGSNRTCQAVLHAHVFATAVPLPGNP